MLIHELAQLTGVSTETIRFYETMGLLSPPARHANNYRHSTLQDVERLRFIASARRLDVALDDVKDILVTRDAGVAPCAHVLAILQNQIHDIDQRIADMPALRASLSELYVTGATLPQDDVDFEHCVCSLIKQVPALHTGMEDTTHGS